MDSNQAQEGDQQSSGSLTSQLNIFQFLSVINQLKKESSQAGNRLSAALEQNKLFVEEKKREEKEQR